MTTLTRRRIEHLVVKCQAAFLDDPRLSLTIPAAQRRFGLDENTCANVLDVLVDAGVLTRHGDVYRRNWPRPAVRPAA